MIGIAIGIIIFIIIFIGVWISLIVLGTKLAKQNKYSGVILLNIVLPGNKMGQSLYQNSAYRSISDEISKIGSMNKSDSSREKTEKEKLKQAFIDDIISSEEYNTKLTKLDADKN